MLQFKLGRELDAVVRDHDSPAINSLIRASNDFCLTKCMAEDIQRPDEHEDLFGAHLPAPEAKFVSENRVVCTLPILELLDKTWKSLQKS